MTEMNLEADGSTGKDPAAPEVQPDDTDGPEFVDSPVQDEPDGEVQ